MWLIVYRATSCRRRRTLLVKRLTYHIFACVASLQHSMPMSTVRAPLAGCLPFIPALTPYVARIVSHRRSNCVSSSLLLFDVEGVAPFV